MDAPVQLVRNLKMLSEALTQYVENRKGAYLPDAESFLDSVNKQLQLMEVL